MDVPFKIRMYLKKNNYTLKHFEIALYLGYEHELVEEITEETGLEADAAKNFFDHFAAEKRIESIV